MEWNITAINKSYKQSNEPIWDLVAFYFSLNSSFSVPAEEQMEKVTYSLLK